MTSLKSSLFIFLFLFVCNKALPQSGNLLNINWDGTSYVLNNIYLPSQYPINYGYLGPGFGGGQSTFDRLYNRYFSYSNDIDVIDAATGTYQELILLPPGMDNIEYNEVSNSLVGGDYQGNFYKIDVLTKTVTTDTLYNGAGMLPLESCFDRINQRYFFRTADSVIVVDSVGNLSTGFKKDLRSIEYDPALNSVFGILPAQPSPNFFRYNLNTMSGSTVSTLPPNNYTFGQNTYDEINQHYYILCSNGALVLNALTGNTIAMVQYYGAGMEHAYIAVLPEPEEPPVVPVGIQTNSKHLAPFIFPNPGDGHFYVANTNEEMIIEVTDGFGKQLLSRKAKTESDQIDLSEYPPGIYLYRLSQNSRTLIKGKLIVR